MTQRLDPAAVSGPLARTRLALALLASACLAVAGCSTPRGAALSTEVLAEQDAETPDFQVVAVAQDNVAALAEWPATGGGGPRGWLASGGGGDSALIRSGDDVTLVIWDNQENSLLTAANQKNVALAPMTVSPTGTIFVPYVGEVVIRGMTPAEARGEVQKALAPTAPSAQVQLSVDPGRQNTVDLVSGVSRPGAVPLVSRNQSILSVIAEAGGIDGSLRNPIVRLIRDGKTYEIWAERLLSDAALNVTMRGGDKVIVAEDARYFTALGATGTEKFVYFESETLSALEAMSLMGGLSESRADPRGVLILREYGAKALRSDGRGPALRQVVFTFDLTRAEGLFAARNFAVHPGDTVLATESPVVAATSVMALFRGLVGLGNSL